MLACLAAQQGWRPPLKLMLTFSSKHCWVSVLPHRAASVAVDFGFNQIKPRAPLFIPLHCVVQRPMDRHNKIRPGHRWTPEPQNQNVLNDKMPLEIKCSSFITFIKKKCFLLVYCVWHFWPLHIVIWFISSREHDHMQMILNALPLKGLQFYTRIWWSEYKCSFSSCGYYNR